MEMNEQTIDLGPIYEPASVAFQFETPGWYILGSIIGALLLMGLFASAKTYLKNAYRREAVKMIHSLTKQFQTQKDAACIQEVMIILKRVAITSYSRKKVANLHGLQWLTFLDSKAKKVSFSKYHETVAKALYQNQITNQKEVLELFTLSTKWIKSHA